MSVLVSSGKQFTYFSTILGHDIRVGVFGIKHKIRKIKTFIQFWFKSHTLMNVNLTK